MNAAAKMIHQSSLFSGQLFEVQLTRPLYTLMTLLMAVLFSAIAVIYTTNEHRSGFSQLHQLEQEATQYQLQWGQLLLEQASLATPARVEKIAVNTLKMQLPVQRQALILRRSK